MIYTSPCQNTGTIRHIYLMSSIFRRIFMSPISILSPFCAIFPVPMAVIPVYSFLNEHNKLKREKSLVLAANIYL